MKTTATIPVTPVAIPAFVVEGCSVLIASEGIVDVSFTIATV